MELVGGERERSQPTRFVPSPIRKSVPVSQVERNRQAWLSGTMSGPGPRAIVGWKRQYLLSEQRGRCADPFGVCPLEGRPLPWHIDGSGRQVFEVDHIIPWHVFADSSHSNLQVLCGSCHSMKTRMDGSGLRRVSSE